MELIETRTINLALVDGYYDGEQAWFTRSQIGEALGYDDPQNAITIIHRRHKERLDKFSRGCQIDTPSGTQDGFVYNFKGVMEICRWSKQPKADEVMDALYDMAESVVKNGYYTIMSAEETIKALAKGMEYDHFMEDVVFPAIEMQNEFTFDKLVEHYCGFPVVTKEDFAIAKKVFGERMKDRKQRLTALNHNMNDFASDALMFKKLQRYNWYAPENRGHYQKIKGERWFDDYILERVNSGEYQRSNEF